MASDPGSFGPSGSNPSLKLPALGEGGKKGGGGGCDNGEEYQGLIHASSKQAGRRRSHKCSQRERRAGGGQRRQRARAASGVVPRRLPLSVCHTWRGELSAADGALICRLSSGRTSISGALQRGRIRLLWTRWARPSQAQAHAADAPYFPGQCTHSRPIDSVETTVSHGARAHSATRRRPRMLSFISPCACAQTRRTATKFSAPTTQKRRGKAEQKRSRGNRSKEVSELTHADGQRYRDWG